MSRSEDILGAAEADAAFAPLTAYDHILLAVSGGPDSLALLILAHDWLKRAPDTKPTVTVATVDHGLRPDSGPEAAAVARLCAGLELPHATLIWEGPKPQRGLPNAARQARYALLATHARQTAPPHGRRIAIVTAHTEDDQAETLFMRLARGGGVRALAAMPSKRTLAGDQSGVPIDLVRPLLAMPKHRLLATLAARGLPFADDPSNRDPAFERPRVRAALSASGLSASALAQTAIRMQGAQAAIDYAKQALADTARLNFHKGVFASLERAAFDAAPSYLQQEVLRDLVIAFGGETPPPQTVEIERLAATLADRRDRRASLGGAVVSAGSSYVRAWRETGRMAVAPCRLTPGETIAWDARFRVGLSPSAPAPLLVRPLGREAYQGIAAMVPKQVKPPAAAAHGLPAFFVAEQLVAVPALGFYQSGAETSILCEPLPALNRLEFAT